ncbi:ATP-dependent helicase [Corynebacterium uberis]|uniref:ATP-dependent DNA helicase n=1 Tax=Corynebacterium sp. c6VSa_13 TaxID=2913496 RepID=UPI001D09E311|nr:ATP-dependent DNA helicase [Corynebacterium uberis]MCZ9309209.1 ATP-dependent helicase [Corynebacterium sp. c6VSa_13]UDL72768.1 ATP-dependent helicase [Corynebacterium uberis]UDL76355.1 ATP-dependent helicase [Corynebacterium uberis]UDL78567.1 ATP-dependent helicase [Corynebacterium uberis]UDL80848.1 ATP-dependent helicase [Corynebacterium uberis]
MAGTPGASTSDVRRQWPQLPHEGSWVVSGPAGSGVSSLLIDAAVARVDATHPLSGLLMIAASKDAGVRMRRELYAALPPAAMVTQDSPVRSIHSLAFALLRQATRTDEGAQVRLITGAEQDAVFRELLAWQAAEGRGGWPAEYVPALTMVGFARQLRDFLLRAAERGVGPERLRELGKTYRRPVWVAAGNFLQEYDRAMALTEQRWYSASELVSAALDQVRRDPDLIADAGWHSIFVDDAHNLDPRSGELIAEVAKHAELVVVGGDPEQSIFHFRGADPAVLKNFPADHHLRLEHSWRHPTRSVVRAATPAAEMAAVADWVRRAHLIDGVEWSQIAVVVRSSPQVEAVRRALHAAGVPVFVPTTDVVLAHQPLVRSVLLAAASLARELTHEEWEAVVLGPVGGADPVTLRRLLRGLRRWDMSRRAMDTLRDLLVHSPDPDVQLELEEVLTGRELEILERVRGVLAAGRQERNQHGSAEEVLWALWQETGVADRLMAQALRGGVAGAQADRDLDAVMALFDAAGDFVERRPAAGVDSFVETMMSQDLPTGVRDRRGVVSPAVEVTTVHATAGRQWARVVIAGAQDHLWPALGETGSLFEQEELVDLLDRDVDPDVFVGRREDKLAEEARLFGVACTRATQAVLITAVHDPDSEEPVELTRFAADLPGATTPAVADAAPDAPAPGDHEVPELGHRVLSRTHLIAELRREVCDTAAPQWRRTQAARGLARLAAAGVPGADPEQWWATTEASTSVELRPAGQTVALSPSRIESLDACPLRAVGEQILGESTHSDASVFAMLKGTLVHGFAEALQRGADPAAARELVTAAFAELPGMPPWARQTRREEWDELLDRTSSWLAARGRFTLVGVEVDVNVDLGNGVAIRGRIDRLDKDDAGDHFIVDLKTGKNAPTQKKTEQQMQLQAYQLALTRGTITARGVTTGQPHPECGGALLVYPGTSAKSVTCRQQAPQTPQQGEQLAAYLPELAHHMRGPRLCARLNDGCSSCRLRTICPLQPEGRASTDV